MISITVLNVSLPIDILKSVIQAPQPYLANDLCHIIKLLYQYQILNSLMNLTATLAQNKKLKIIIEIKEFYTLDDGNCVTIEGGTWDKMTNIFKTHKTYKITLKKLSADVFIHEIGHMAEKELALKLDDSFISAITKDLSRKSGNVSLNVAIKQIMIDEVKEYSKDQHASELFTRYFQLLSISKEISGFNAQYGFKINDVFQAFANLNYWLQKFFESNIISKINPEILKASKQLLVPIEKIKHQWSNDKIKPIHHINYKSKWSSITKSIDD